MLKIITALIFSFLSLTIGEIVQASEINFTVRAVLPENQRSKETSYFDLRVVPGEKQLLNVELENDTEEDIVVFASANSAITNDNGAADYSYRKTKKDPSATVTFSEIATIPKEIVLPKKSKKIVDCTLTIPKTAFDGYVLGGLYFEQKEDQEQTKQNKEALAVGNRFSYVIGVLLSENDKEVRPDMALNEVTPTQLNGHNAVIMAIQNKKAAMIKTLQMDAKLYYENEKKPRYENHQESLTMAPNTSFNYKIDLKEQPFVAGNYTVKVKANDGYRDWFWEKKFKIEEKEAKKYNATAINLPPEKNAPFSLELMIGIALAILLLIISIIYYFKRKMKKEQKLQQEKYEKLRRSIEQQETPKSENN